MITSSDHEYKRTKRLVLGESRLKPPFDEMAAWISDRFGVRVLNVIYDPKGRDALTRPRLQVILEHATEVKAFDDTDGNFDKTKQEEISQRFREVIESALGSWLGRARHSLVGPRFGKLVFGVGGGA